MIFVHKFKNHKKIKNNLLSLIDEIPNEPIDDGDSEKISKTDWNLPKNLKRKYLEFFYEEIEDSMSKICKIFKAKTWIIQNAWFQQYLKGDSHGWHNHSRSNISAVYYLELPYKNLVTEFLNKTKVDIKEGDILFFPSFLMHRSPKHKGKRKTVISFNCSFSDWNGEL
tara:strand:- start:88 stop:591 length:504 start_codon:yes stop_codon:yes gene_type:complete